MSNYFVGIDNGVSGGMAVIDERGILFDARLVPTKKIGDTKVIAVNELLMLSQCFWNKNCDKVFFTLEQGQKQPLFGCKGNFANGYSMGLVEGMLITMGVPYGLANPKTWQEAVFKDMRGYTKGKKNDTKSLAIEWCARRFPSHKIEDHNIADAVCLAWYGRSQIISAFGSP